MEHVPHPELDALRRLARARGVQDGFIDYTGTWREPSVEAMLGVLDALGTPLSRPADALDALRRLEAERLGRMLPPVVVAWEHRPCDVRLVVPESLAGSLAEANLDLENGDRLTWAWDLSESDTEERLEADGRVALRKRCRIPFGFPWGYHRLSVQANGDRADALLISAPNRCHEFPRETAIPPGHAHDHAHGSPRPTKLWGAFLPLHAMWSELGAGLPTYADFERLGRELARHGGGVMATLPFLAQFLDEPCEPSPYSPASRLFWNEFYVDPTRAPEWERCEAARRLAGSAEFLAEARALAQARWVDYRREAALRRRVLETLARDFFENPASDRAPLEAFLRETPDAEDYARFRAVGERERREWRAWPEAPREGNIRPEDHDEDAFRYHLYAQMLASSQIASLGAAAAESGRGPGLYLDLPLGVNGAGYDVWRRRDLFPERASAGAPPDGFFTRGQDWGFPPVRPDASRESGHAYVVQYLRRHLRHAGMLRIDHVMGLHRLFWIPRGLDARDGAYVRYPGEELYAILALESRRARAVVVGEDLGTVPDETRYAMDQQGLLKMFVLPFELRPWEEERVARPGRDSIACVNTHDLPAFRAFWEGLDVEDRRDLGLIDEAHAAREREERARVVARLAEWLSEREGRTIAPEDWSGALRAFLRRLGESDSVVALLNLEDLWGETLPQNTPGTSHERPNWTRRAALPLERFLEVPGAVEALRAMDEARRERAGGA